MTKLTLAVDAITTYIRPFIWDVSFNELFSMYQSKELILPTSLRSPWSETEQSQFIESIILELPIPPIYAVTLKGGDGVYELIDGFQRIFSYFHFRGIDLKKDTSHYLVLQGCDILPELNGLTYEDLPYAIQNKIKRHFLRMEVITRYDNNLQLYDSILKRLNIKNKQLLLLEMLDV